MFVRNMLSACCITEFVWMDAAIRLLVSSRLAMDGDFQHPKCKKSKLWAAIAKKWVLLLATN